MFKEEMPEWVTWVFSGVGVAVIGLLFSIFRKNNQGEVSQNQHVSINIDSTNDDAVKECNEISVDTLRAQTKILFIDDDSKFKVVDILKRSGWKNTKSIKDVKDLNSIEIQSTDIFFVDIKGVGVSLGFKDEGLGLASAIKDKYNNKKIVIYSAETKGERFHEALKKADDSLPKNADPYEFEQIIETFARDIAS